MTPIFFISDLVCSNPILQLVLGWIPAIMVWVVFFFVFTDWVRPCGLINSYNQWLCSVLTGRGCWNVLLPCNVLWCCRHRNNYLSEKYDEEMWEWESFLEIIWNDWENPFHFNKLIFSITMNEKLPLFTHFFFKFKMSLCVCLISGSFWKIWLTSKRIVNTPLMRTK